MPTPKLNNPNNKLNHVYASASQALQIKELSSKIQANTEAWLSNATIDIDKILSLIFPDQPSTTTLENPLNFLNSSKWTSTVQ